MLIVHRRTIGIRVSSPHWGGYAGYRKYLAHVTHVIRWMSYFQHIIQGHCRNSSSTKFVFLSFGTSATLSPQNGIQFPIY